MALWVGFCALSGIAISVVAQVVSSGIKVMVLAVIVGIGSNFFTEFVGAMQSQEPDIGKALSLVLAAMTLFGLRIFGPGIATGLISGGPQLGAGAAVGTALGAAGLAVAGGAAVVGGARLAARSGAALRSATSLSASARQSDNAPTRSATTAGAAAGKELKAGLEVSRSRT